MVSLFNMPNARISNPISNSSIRNFVPNVRASNFQTGLVGDPVIKPAVGTPIGLLLALTYAEVLPFPPFSDFRPNARITSQ